MTPDRISLLRAALARGYDLTLTECQALLDIAERFARLRAILEPLRALEAAATKAPWSYERHATIYRVNEQGRPVQLVIETGSPDGGDTEPSFQGKDADTDILLAARNALPALLREIQEAP